MNGYVYRPILDGWMVTTIRRKPVAKIDKQGNSFTGWNGQKFTCQEGQKYATLNDFLKVWFCHTYSDVNFKETLFEVEYFDPHKGTLYKRVMAKDRNDAIKKARVKIPTRAWKVKGGAEE